jgi:hypothetical protein
MRHFTFFFGLFLMLIGCASSRKSPLETPLKKISLHALVHKPYCGGAKPTPEIAKGTDETLANADFVVFKGTSMEDGATAILKFKTNAEGKANFQLEQGTYCVYATEKMMSIEALKTKFNFNDPRNYVFRDDKCFAMWKKTPDLAFQVINDTLIRFIQNAKCWTGTVPCVDYIGKPAQ